MNLFELFDRDVPGYQSIEDDQSQQVRGNLRKTKLTLLQLNKMRLLNDVRAFEQKQKITAIRKQYGTPTESDSGGF